MNSLERRDRDRKIERLFREGLQPSAISNRVKLQVDRVRDILVDRGLIVPVSQERANDGMWDGDENKRRQRFYERQKAGAREALRAIKP